MLMPPLAYFGGIYMKMIYSATTEQFLQPLDPFLIEAFISDAEKTIASLQEDYLVNKDLTKFVISVHGMKSALMNIGENEKSQFALELENAGRNGDTTFINANIDSFIDMLKTLVKELNIIAYYEADGAETLDESPSRLR